MKRRLLLSAAAASVATAALAAPAHHAAPAHRPAPAHHAAAPAVRDWSRVVAATPEGGFRMGNPAARVKLVEYASLSCPFCKNFEDEGGAILRDRYVRSGRVSWEFRTYMNHPTDPAVSALVHCHRPDDFFTIAEQLYASQAAWYGRLVATPRAQLEPLQRLSVTQRDAAVARITGIDDFFVRHGMPRSQVQSCLANMNVLDKLAAIMERANRDGVDGTPTFLINGAKNDAHDWQSLEPLLRQAGG